LEICIVGAGPRGLSVFERLVAIAGERGVAGGRVRVHLVDPHVHDGSAVWRTGQARNLLMNTVASQITMFVDETVDCAGPMVEGPSLYDWARFVARFDSFDDNVPEWVRNEGARLGPDEYPTRAFYGYYLQWVLRHLMRTAPEHVEVSVYPQRAVGVADGAGGRQEVRLSDGTALGGLEAVVLTQGHLPARISAAEEKLAAYAARNGLRYVAPVNPAEVELDDIAPGEPVVVRGMGLNFFDYMALLTVGRGGGFVRNLDDRLEYHPSGQEPLLITGSRRGVPYHARGENQKGPFGRYGLSFLTPKVIAGMRAQAEAGDPVDFREQVWPIIDRDVRAVYYARLLSARSGERHGKAFMHRYRMLWAGGNFPAPPADPLAIAETGAERELLAAFGIGPDERWDWHAIAHPYGDKGFAGGDEYHTWLISYLAGDVREAKRGNVRSPVKAALDIMRDLRNEIRLVVDHGGVSGESYRDDLQGWYTPLNAFVSIGPPVRRIEELIALIEAGVVHVLGPGMTVGMPEDGADFLATSRIPGQEYRSRFLIEARMPDPDIRATTDPLISGLLASGECALHQIPWQAGGYYQTGGLAVTPRPYNLLDAGRRPHPRRFAFGVPTETVHWVTAAGIRPGVNSVILADADAVAHASLAVAGNPSRQGPVTMPAEPSVESGLLSPGWAGTGVDALVSDAAWVQAMLDAEAALARAQAELGVVPKRAAETIADCCRVEKLDLAGIATGVHATANPVVVLVNQLTSVVSDVDATAADYVHRGSTSQDILDSGMMLVCARALSYVDDQLARCARGLASLVEQHRDTAMVGRTLTQHAVPITFGLKAAGWLELVLDARERVRRVRADLPASLGGAAGTLSAYAEYAELAGVRHDGGVELIEPFAAQLGLRAPLVPWHGIRTPLADVAGALATTTGALGKFAQDVQVLTRTEIREVIEPSAPGRGASSAMPQKHNPVYATLIMTAARQLPPYATVLFQSMIAEDERSAGAWHAEWQPLRECLRLAAGAATNAAALAEGLVVVPERMRENLKLTGAALVSERLTTILAPLVGKAAAKKLLTAVIEESEKDGTDLVEAIVEAVAREGKELDLETVRASVDPEQYVGASVALADRVLARYRGMP
jgi:3-carboxy-cis,cis-muconate cycloisomerase